LVLTFLLLAVVVEAARTPTLPVVTVNRAQAAAAVVSLETVELF
jgi:hypothetical protein